MPAGVEVSAWGCEIRTASERDAHVALGTALNAPCKRVQANVSVFWNLVCSPLWRGAGLWLTLFTTLYMMIMKNET